MPRMKRPSSSVSTIAISAAVAAGWFAEVHGAAAQLDLARIARQRRDEDQARGDGFGEVGDVLADEGFLEAELLGEQHRLAVLFQRLAPVAADRVQRHGEVAKLHASKRAWRSLQVSSTSSGIALPPVELGEDLHLLEAR